MQLTLLLPDVHRFAAAAISARWLARGDRETDSRAGRDAQLRAHFEFPGTAMPAAALTRSLDASDADSAQWLRCDPASVMADAVTLRLVACGNLQLSAEEVDEFSRVLKPLFGDAGFPLETTRSGRWYLRCPREAKLPKFSDPADALGDDLAHHLPDGDNARQWRGLLNEAQIVLTQHPLNARRVRLGLPPVNSVWFWGAGALPDWVRCGFSEIETNDEVTAALARMAKIPHAPPSAPVEKLQEERGESGTSLLLDLIDQRDIAVLESGWFAPLDALLAKRKLDAVHLHFLGGERATVRPAHRWRFWRRVKSGA